MYVLTELQSGDEGSFFEFQVDIMSIFRTVDKIVCWNDPLYIDILFDVFMTSDNTSTFFFIPFDIHFDRSFKYLIYLFVFFLYFIIFCLSLIDIILVYHIEFVNNRRNGVESYDGIDNIFHLAYPRCFFIFWKQLFYFYQLEKNYRLLFIENVSFLCHFFDSFYICVLYGLIIIQWYWRHH